MTNAVNIKAKNSVQAAGLGNNGIIKKKNRTYVFDILRIFACFMVIVNHTNSAIFNTFFPSLSGQASLVLFFISKTAVPIFFMISGALLLSKQDSYKTAYGKRAFRIAADIVIFSVATTLIYNKDFSVLNLEFFTSLINKPYITPFWYLYSYFALMLMLPFLQRLVSAMSKKDFVVLLTVLFFFQSVMSFMSYLEILPSASNYFMRNLFSGEILYFFLGYFICHFLPDFINTAAKKRIALIVSAVIFLVGILFCWYRTGLEFYENGKFSLSLDNIYSLPIVLYSSALFIFVFLLLKNVNFSGWFAKVLTIISNATFGIYLTHYIIIKETNPVMQILKDNMNDFIAILIMDVAVFVIGAIGITILRMIPVVKKFL